MRTLSAVVAVVALTGGLSLAGTVAAFADSPTPYPEPLPAIAPIPQPGPDQHLVQWVDGSTYVFPCGTPTPEIINTLTTDWEITQWIQGTEYAISRGRHITVTTTDNAQWPVGVTCGTADNSGAAPAGFPSTFSPLWTGPTPVPTTAVPYTAAPAPTTTAPVAPAPTPTAATAVHPQAPSQPAVPAAAPVAVPQVVPAVPSALLTEWQRMVHRIF